MLVPVVQIANIQLKGGREAKGLRGRVVGGGGEVGKLPASMDKILLGSLPSLCSRSRGFTGLHSSVYNTGQRGSTGAIPTTTAARHRQHTIHNCVGSPVS